jgi:hypothetical protein
MGVNYKKLYLLIIYKVKEADALVLMDRIKKSKKDLTRKFMYVIYHIHRINLSHCPTVP